MIIECLIKNDDGDPIGKIRISEDGTFTGSFSKTTSFVEVFGSVARDGMASGIILKPELIPAVPKPPPCSSARDESHYGGTSIALVEIPTFPSVHLCKTCLDQLLDWADDQPFWEPKQIKFLDEQPA